MIASFADSGTGDLHNGTPSRKARRFPPDVVRIALRKLDMLNAATSLGDLSSPRGNRLEALKGDLRGRHSIRVNDQWHIVFRWDGSDAHEVQLVDYHRGAP